MARVQEGIEVLETKTSASGVTSVVIEAATRMEPNQYGQSLSIKTALGFLPFLSIPAAAKADDAPKAANAIKYANGRFQQFLIDLGHPVAQVKAVMAGKGLWVLDKANPTPEDDLGSAVAGEPVLEFVGRKIHVIYAARLTAGNQYGVILVTGNKASLDAMWHAAGGATNPMEACRRIAEANRIKGFGVPAAPKTTRRAIQEQEQEQEPAYGGGGAADEVLPY